MIATVIFGLISTVLSALVTRHFGLSNAQREQNDFNASEAQRARDFSAQEAEISRDWQEDMYAKYNSLQGKIAQANGAGVNPLFAVTDSAVSPMSPQSPSVSAPAASASAVGNQFSGLADIAQAALGFSKFQTEVENIKAQTRQMNAQALKTELESLWVDKLNSQTIAESVKRIQVADVTIGEKNANISLLTAKVLESEATTQEKLENIKLIAANVNNTEADTQNKIVTYQQIIATINNTEADTNNKKALYAKILAETRNERLMSGLITQNTHLSRAQRKEAEAVCRKIWQQYDHDAIMNGFDELARELEMATVKHYNPQSEFGQMGLHLLNIFSDIFSLGGYTSYYESNSRTTSTVTTIDGNSKPKHNRIGF